MPQETLSNFLEHLEETLENNGSQLSDGDTITKEWTPGTVATSPSDTPVYSTRIETSPYEPTVCASVSAFTFPTSAAISRPYTLLSTPAPDISRLVAYLAYESTTEDDE